MIIKLNKINVLLKGDIGNQLFIYTALNKIKKNIKDKYEVKFYQLSKYIWSKKGKFFNLYSIFPKKIISITLPRIFEEILYFFKFYLFKNVIKDNSRLKVVSDRQITLNGYFQKRKWYENEWENTVKFIFNNLNKNFKAKKYPIIISLALGETNIKYKRTLDFEYYLKALKALKIKKNDNIYIVGLYTKEILRNFIIYLKKNNYKKITILNNKKQLNSYNKSILDFITIAKSKKLIMSNSTFCWWASVSRTYHNLESKNVIAPKKWVKKNLGDYGNPNSPKKIAWKFIDNKII